MSQTPRHINTSRSLNRPDPAAAAPRHAASSTDAKQSAGGAHNEPPRRPAQGAGQKPPRRRKKKKKMPLWLPFAVVMAIIAVISGVVVYGVSLVNKVEDSIRPDDSTPTIEEEVKTAEEYKGDVVNILVCGIDYEEGRNYSNDPTSNDGRSPATALSPPRTKRSPFPMERPTPPRIIRSTRWQSPTAAASPLWPMLSTISSDCPSITM